MGSRSKKDRHLAQTPSGDMVAYQRTEFRADILPPPDELERYEAMYPGTAKTILDTYVSQVEHRIKLETSVIEGDIRRADRGQIVSAIIAFLSIATGGLLTFVGKDIVGLSLIVGSI
jgi:uncharacterized membrane protein